MTDDEKVAQRYSELGAEEPPRALDEAILAAARREAGAGPASLPGRGGRQRWYAPLATAAVLVLAVAVTLNMQLERPDVVSPAQQAVPPPAEQPASQLELKLKAETKLGTVAKQPVKDTSPSRRKEAVQAPPPAPATREPQPFAAERPAAPAASAGAAAPRSDDARGAESSVTSSLAKQMEERTTRDAEAAARAPRMAAIQSQARRAQADQARNQPDTPEGELERIAQLRAQGRHDEADKALAEFRKRFPDFRISDALRERVERR